VALPAIAAPPSRTADHAISRVAASRPCRLLIVEDNDDAREMLRIALEHDGHEVHEAADGLAGLEAALSLRPDIALIDVGLPGFDGYEVARRIRGRPEGKGIYLVALTGYGQAEDRRRSEAAGFDEHIVKPVDPLGLASVLARAAAA
jgi:CheY-like chemotaxis protein